VINYLDNLTQKNAIPYINNNFLDYQTLSIADVTGSYLSPYVTTIGVYSGLDLIMVAKLGSPIKLIPNFPFNFALKMDF
jgi:hypothetical protein